MEENNNIVEEKKEKKNNNLLVLIIAIVISLVIGIILGKLLFNNGDDTPKNNSTDNTIIDNVENNNNPTNDNTDNNNIDNVENNNNPTNDNTDNNNNNITINKLSGKIDLNSYCPISGSCQKEIGIVTINNQDLTLSVDLNNINTDSVNGYILLGSNKIDVSKQGNFKALDGFEIYKEYFIIYMSNTNADFYNYNCGNMKMLKYYTIVVFDAKLNKVTDFSGITPNNAFKDTKIENDSLYFYTAVADDIVNGIIDEVDYEKINIDDFIIGKHDTSSHVTISKTKCN